jgi:hypothetical protein
MSRPVPFRPDRAAAREASSTSLIRAVAADLLSRHGRRVETADQIAERSWPADGTAGLILRAVSNPATIGTPAWAGSLGYTANADLISSLGPASVALVLLGRGIRLQWDRAAGVRVPGIITAPVGTFTGEGNPIGVWDLTTSGITLTSKKLPTIVAFSREIFEHSVPNVEVLVRTGLSESLALALDYQMFSANAGDTGNPPGLLNGIAALPASTASLPSEAMFTDIAAVNSAVSAVAGNNAVTVVAAPPQAEAARIRLDIDREILSCHGLPAGTIAAVATNALASIIDPAPSFSSSIDAVYHLDTAPSPIGGPSGVAAMTVSSFQSDLVSLRLIINISWGLRHPSGVAWIQGCTWG